ncbi:MAG TPA: N-acetyl-gamma-glutamyl-phosphate reductase [Actinomycetaceae bacterium]|nr:N-acetyl-gamma-glutamyl-phosphate reductase [Actinomycetaceae bacterium]
MTFTVAVAGASGYAGGEILRFLLNHPDAKIGPLTAAASAGTRLEQHHPHLRPLAGRVIEETHPETLAQADVVFLGLPHGASGEVAAALEALGSDALILDCGADFRLTDAADWEAFYGSAHAGTWPYGLPELLHDGETSPSAQREVLAGARRIAVPGCNVAAVTLAIQPGAHLVDTTDMVATLAVGYSGAGKAMKSHLMASEALGSAAPYAVGGTHRHIPEIEQNLRVSGAETPKIAFQPILVPMSRGILASVTASYDGDATTLREAWTATYEDEPFVQLLPEGTWPTTAMVAGSNEALVQVGVDAHAGRVIAMCALDNLGKGTAGTAIQSMNLALGLPESTGLTTVGVAP